MTPSFPRNVHAAAPRESWPLINLKTDPEYDWSKSTVDVYRAEVSERTSVDDKTTSAIFTEKFASARKKLDYSYHVPLVLPRQSLQDTVLERVVDAATAAESSFSTQQEQRPWMIFTAGPMGVGKGYFLAHISEMIGMEKYLHIDPDKLKQELPELPGYIQADQASAGTKVHPESTQMADILLEHALDNNRPVLIDGSLRDVEYYTSFMQRIRDHYSSYRIAILHVTASPDTIRQRATQRGELTGRFIPEELLQASMEQVPRSVAALAHLTDAVHVISNETTLQLESSEIRKEGIVVETKIQPSWQDFATMFTSKKQVVQAPPPLATTMEATFMCPRSHEVARRLWQTAYPTMCVRCALACDGQCGMCVHGKHMCGGCQECERGEQKGATLKRQHLEEVWACSSASVS